MCGRYREHLSTTKYIQSLGDTIASTTAMWEMQRVSTNQPLNKYLGYTIPSSANISKYAVSMYYGNVDRSKDQQLAKMTPKCS